MTIAIAKSYLDITPVHRYEGGILSVANVIPATGHDLMGAEYMTDACTEGGLWTEICYAIDLMLCEGGTPTPPVGGLKVFGEPSLVEGEPFAVYDGLACPAIGDIGDAATRARLRLGYSEGRQIDMYMQTMFDSLAPAPIVGTDLADIIGQFETIAALEYGGTAIIHMSRSHAVCAKSRNLIETAMDGSLVTVNGTRVGALAAMPDHVESLYLTGQITLLQGNVITRVVPEVIRPDGTCDPRRALAERILVPLVECTVITATAPCETAPAVPLDVEDEE